MHALRGRRKPFYGWAIVAVGAIVAFSSGPGQSFIFSVFLDSIIEDTGLTRTAVSTLYAVGTGLSAMMVFTVSRLADRYGARTTLIAAATALGIACMAMSQARGALLVFLAFSALRALGQGSMTIHGTLLTAQWFVRRRGRAMAIMGLGFPVSVALLPPVTRWIIDTVGWREAYIALGVMVWVLVLPAAFFVVRDRPEDMGLYPDGADAPPEGEVSRPTTGPRGDRAILGSLRFWMLALPLATPALVITGLVFHQAGILAEQGMSSAVSAAMFIPYAVASAVIALLAGDLADRFGPKLIFFASMAALILASGAALFVTSLPTAIMYAAILGSSAGFSQIVGAVTWAHFYGRQGLGRIQGSAAMINIAASALGPLPYAALQTTFEGFRVGIAIMAVLPAIAIVAVILAKPPGDRAPTAVRA